METNVNYTVVGAFVICLVAAIALGIIWLSVGFSIAEYDIYKIYMQEPVSGLNSESPVEFNGVEVGNIRSIEINRKNPQLVELLLNVKDTTPVTLGTTAKLSIRGITGVTFIALQDRGTNKTPLRAREGQPYPVIRTVPSILVKLDTALTKLTMSLQQISDSLKAIFDVDNQKAFKVFLHNASVASEQFSPVLEKASKTITIFETQTLPNTQGAINNFGTMSNNLSKITHDLKQNPAMLIRGRQPRALGPGER